MEAVDQEAGGNNTELAKKIASNHPSIRKQSMTVFSTMRIDFEIVMIRLIVIPYRLNDKILPLLDLYINLIALPRSI